LSPACTSSIVSIAAPCGLEEQPGGDDQHRHVDDARHTHCQRDVHPLVAQKRMPFGGVAGGDALLGERRVEVDHVRHDRGAEDPGGEQNTVGSGEARHQTSGHAFRVRTRAQQVVKEAEQDHPQQSGDDDLEPAVAAALERQQAEGHRPRDDSSGEQRDPEEQVQRDRPTDDLGEVGGHRDRLCLAPEPPHHRGPVVLAAQLREVAPGCQADLG